MAVLEDLDPGGLLSDEEQHLEEFDDSNEVLLPPETAETIHTLVEGIITFGQEFCGIELFPYQHDLAYRIIESLLINDGEEITALQSRQCLDGDTVVFRRDGSACRLRDHEDAWSTGVKPTKRYVVRGGGEIVATDNHPVMTDRGWVPAGLLQVGDKVSVMEEWVQWSGVEHVEREVQYGRHLSQHQSVAVKFTEDLLRLLGYMVTDGSNRPGQSLKFTNIRPEYLSEVENLVLSEFGIAAKRYPKGNGADLLFTTSKATGSNPMRLAWQALQWDHKFPLDVFNLPEHLVGEFVNRAWAGDGCVGTKRRRGGRVPEVFLACGNDEVYARYWQALLLKLGVTSTVKREHMGKGTGTFHRLVVSPAGRNIRKFLEVTGEIYGKEEGSRAALAAAPRDRPVAPPTWHCPGVSKHLYRDGYQGAVLEECVRCGSPDPRISTGSYATEPMVHLDGPDGEGFVYRSIVRIEDAGEREVFDVDYGEKGWFVAQGVQVHNSGKTEVLSLVIVSCMVLLPRLAVAYPNLIDQKFKRGFMVGCFAPTDEQSETLHSRVVTYLTSDTAVEMYLDPEIDDEAEGRGKVIKLVKSGSFCRRQTANPRASIESKSYHFIIIDEAQEADDYTVSKCVAEGTPVWLPDGRILPVEQVVAERLDVLTYDKPWDVVAGPRPTGGGQRNKIDRTVGTLVGATPTEWHDNGEKEVFAVTTATGRRIEATDNHRWIARRRQGNRIPTEYQTAELRVGDLLPVPLTAGFFGDAGTEAEGYFIGAMLGDGCTTGGSPLWCGFADGSMAFMRDFSEKLGCTTRVNNVQISGLLEVSFTSPGNAQGSNGVTELLRLHGVWGLKGSDKKLPRLDYSKEFLAGLVAGLVDTDGSVESGRVSFSNTSEALCRQLQDVLLKLGVMSNLFVRENNGSYGSELPLWTVTVKGVAALRRLWDEVSLKNEAKDRAFTALVEARMSTDSRQSPASARRAWDPTVGWDRIVSIEPAGVKRTYCVTVEPSHTVVWNGLVGKQSIHPMAAFYNGCLTGDARILMADGTLEELGDLVAKRPAGAQVLALEDEGLQELGLVPRAIERYHDNGVRPTVRVNLRGHRSVTSTLNHRFVKVGNIRRNKWSWARADELAPGDRIAVPWQEYSVGVSEESTLPELLGWVISEGCLTSTSVEVAVSVPHLVEDVGRLVGEYGDDLKWTHNGDRKGRITHAQGRAAGRGGSGAGTGPRPNRLQLELQRLGLWGHGAKTKRIPSECFGWNNDALARLLSRLYAGDGCIHHGSSPVISYSTISEGLKEDLLHALDRFGVYATVTEEPPPADPFPGSLTRRHTSYTVTIADPVSQRRFLDSVGWMKKSNDFDGFVAALDRSCKSRDLPIRFVTVLSVEDAGEQPTYDLQVAGSRNYVANGIISHNTIVKIGTPSRTKGNFYKAVQLNKRRQTRTGMRQNHFEFNWKFCARYNENYNRFIRKEMVRIGQDSDEFMLSYELRWLLSRGMFVTEDLMEDLGNKSMQIVPVWHETPVLVGVDPAKTVDSTVVTVLWVNWDHPDEFGYYESRVLNWLELIGEEWEEQYFQITDFLRNYNVYAIGVDGTGVGDVVADRLARLLPRCEVHALKSSEQEQSKRWKHLQELMNRRRVSWPAHAKTRRLKKWQRFYQQMTDAEKRYRGPSMIVEAPDETDAHDDYVDSLALAVSLTAEMSMPYVMVEDSPFYK